LVEVQGTNATFTWTPSTGSVKSYAVEVARNLGEFTEEQTVSEPQVIVSGKPGERLSLRVVALGWDGSRSDPSPPSDEIKLLGWGAANSSVISSDGADKKGADKKGAANKRADKKGADKKGAANKRADKKGAGDGWNGAWSDSSQPPPAPLPSSQAAMPYDFNGDGRTDLLWRNRLTNAAAVWLMNGTSPSQIVDLGALEEKWRFVGSGDFDGDGYADLVVRNSARGRSEIWFIEEGAVRSAIRFDDPGDRWSADAIGDFDGDGYADLLWRKAQKSLFWFMRGSTVDEAVFGPWVQELMTADCAPELDGDGRSDLIWSSGQETVAWLMEGSSPWRSGPAGPPMEESLAIGCGDADGDWLGDVLWYHPGSRSGTLWVMDGHTAMDQSFELPRLQAGWAIEASGDFDGDGLANEILIRNATSGRIEIWKLQWNGSRTSFSVASTAGAGMGSGSWQVIAP
jgi:hypothetical protein